MLRRTEEESTVSDAANARARQTSLAESFGFGAAGRHYPDDSPRAATLTRCLGQMIVNDLQPLSIVEDQGRNALCLNQGELSLIKQTVDALRPFEEVTREVSADKYVSVSKVIPLVSLIHRAVAACECQGSSLAAQLAQQCQRRFRGIESIYCLAASTFLDVRCKHLGFRDKDNVEVMKKRLLSEMQEVYQTRQAAPTLAPSSTATVSSSPYTSTSGPSTSEPNQSPAPSGSAVSKGGIWTDFDMQVLSGQHHRSAASDVLIEIRRYSEEKVIPRDSDALVWWKEHEPTFPALSKLAVRYMGITATSVPAERVFSKAGEVHHSSFTSI
ncbi:hypothetical protein SRHO_G00148090 [Serrasalmus rhombeus]